MNYSTQELLRAKAALELQRKLAYASTADVHKVISHGTITNLEVSNSDLYRGIQIEGESVAVLKGKTRSSNPLVFQDNKVVTNELRRQVLFSDIFFVEGIPFLLSVMSPCDYVLTNQLSSRSADALVGTLHSQLNFAKQNNFEISHIFFDGEGAVKTAKLKLEEKHPGLVVEQSTSKVPVAERKIQTLKGRVRSVIMGLPFLLCHALLALCVLWCTSRLNMVPSIARPDQICAFEAIYGRKLDMQRDLKYKFGDYVEVPSTLRGLTLQSSYSHLVT